LLQKRARVLLTFDGTTADRVPVDFGGHRSSGIAALVYPKLRRALGLPSKPVRVYDVIQQLAVIDDDVLDGLRIDTIELGRGFSQDECSWADWSLPDGSPCQVPVWALPERQDGRWVLRSKSGKIIAHMPDGALYFEQCYWPFLEKDDLSQMERAFDECMWTSITCPPGPVAEDADAFATQARRFRQSTERAILGLFGGSLLETGEFFYRIDNFLALLAGEPRRAHAFLDKLTELHLHNLERYLNAVGESLDIILFGDDLGMQTGPLISPRMYREFFKPRHSLLWNTAKRLADVKVLLHCCGGVRELLPDLIDAGLDAINPVQISCAGMDAAGLKRDFGKEITFWGGGCDTQTVLPSDTPQQVAAHVKQQIQTMRPGGRFVFQQVHNIVANVPVDNILAMFGAVKAAQDDQEPQR
jgi:uroporphyrinogen decarboxylase